MMGKPQANDNHEKLSNYYHIPHMQYIWDENTRVRHLPALVGHFAYLTSERDYAPMIVQRADELGLPDAWVSINPHGQGYNLYSSVHLVGFYPTFILAHQRISQDITRFIE